MDKTAAQNQLAAVIRKFAKEKRVELERLKQEHSGLARHDFIWHYLLQSFSTMGRASGRQGLIVNENNYKRITYNVLAALATEARRTQIRDVCRAAKIRMPDKKADYIMGCFDYVRQLGGPEAAKTKLLAQRGREAKIRFLQTFPGIGPKYARNIMMDVYHEEFRDSIALDVRIKAISEALGLSFSSYTEHESFYLSVAQDAGINGWELDRLLFNYRDEVESRLGLKGRGLDPAKPKEAAIEKIFKEESAKPHTERQKSAAKAPIYSWVVPIFFFFVFLYLWLLTSMGKIVDFFDKP
jgi:thermostable 8-oxoguanine DNA glycosylase